MGDKLGFIDAVLDEVETITEGEDIWEKDAYLEEVRERLGQARQYVRELQAEYQTGEDDR
jgi:hypothetical protein